MSAAPALASWNAGEFSPLLASRIDYSKYATGASVLENFIPTVQGPLIKRGGTRFVAEVKASSKQTWLTTFEYNVSNAYVLEFGDAYIRFFTQHAQLVDSSVPVEVVSPYVQADLFNSDGTSRVRTAQSGDLLYITHGSHEPRVLTRTSATAFSLSAFRPDGGPFKDLNITATTVYASAATGTGITLTASSSIFQAGHVGSLFLLEAKDTNSIPAWEVGKTITAGDTRIVGSRVYEALTSGTTGSKTPVHTSGAFYDGDPGVQWQFLNAGFGWARITAYTSGTQVTADVVSRVPAGAVGGANATTRWAHAAWSSVEGWPTDVTFFRERLVFARGQQIWMSTAGGFSDFSARNPNGEIAADQAISITIASGSINEIQWLMSDQFLIAGTAGGEFIIGELTNGQPLGPGNIKAKLQSRFGSRAIVPVSAGASVLFVQRSGRKVRELVMNAGGDGYDSTDRTALANHIGKSGIVDMDYSQEPYSVAWATRADGRLVGFTWNAEQNVWAWHPHSIGAGFVESVAVIPSPDQSRNELWLIVRRTVNGQTKRYVEYMEAEWTEESAQSSAFYVDSGLSYSGSSVSALTGLGHLEGMTVSVLVDGSPHPSRVVSSGAITLQRSGAVVNVGLPYSAKMRTMRLEAGARNGTAQGKTKRITRVVYRFDKTASGQFGPNFTDTDEFNFRTASDLMDQPVPLFTGDVTVAWPGGYETDGYICYIDELPLPVTLCGVFPTVETQDGQ